MRRKKLAVVLLCMACMLMSMVTGCGARTAESTPIETDESVASATAEDHVYITLYALQEPMEEAPEADQDLTTTMVAQVAKEDLSVETIVSEYNRMIVESTYGQPFAVNEVKKTNQQARVDFDSESVKALNIEQGNEGQVFYNLARSIAENLSDVDEIYFTMDGNQDFELGHLWFEADRPFYSGIAPLESEDVASSSLGPE